MSKLTILSFAIAATTLIAASAQAEQAFGITGASAGVSLVSFDTATPSGLTSVGSLTGVPAGHSVRAIDFRPSNGQLYALSTDATNNYLLYTVNTATAALTTVGGGSVTGNFPSRVSMDFNPRVDLLRVISASNHNLRVSPLNGSLVGQDTNLAFSTPDPDPSFGAFMVGAAYDNNFVGATSTTLYAWDFNDDQLVTIGSVGGAPTGPNSGQMFHVGPTPLSFISTDGGIGMDISSTTGTAFLQFNDSLGDVLSTINLANGVTSFVGDFGTTDMLDISIVIPEPTTLGLLAGVTLLGKRRRTR